MERNSYAEPATILTLRGFWIWFYGKKLFLNTINPSQETIQQTVTTKFWQHIDLRKCWLFGGNVRQNKDIASSESNNQF